MKWYYWVAIAVIVILLIVFAVNANANKKKLAEIAANAATAANNSQSFNPFQIELLKV